MVAAVSMTAQAADETLTLACQSTTTAGTEDKPEPISMGIIVNFTKKTVHGFGDPIFGEQLIKITGLTETAVYFSADDLGAVSPEAQWEYVVSYCRSNPHEGIVRAIQEMQIKFLKK